MSAITVTASEANRSFSRLLRLARDGTLVHITSHGRPVASLGPARAIDETAEEQRRADALANLRSLWDDTPTRMVGRWTRDEIYEDRLRKWF